MQSLPQGSMMRFGCSANWASITRIDAHERLAHPDILVLADQHRRDDHQQDQLGAATQPTRRLGHTACPSPSLFGSRRIEPLVGHRLDTRFDQLSQRVAAAAILPDGLARQLCPKP